METLPRRADGWAFFLDFDGTLVEIADTPDGVVVPRDLAAELTRVAARADGALAVVSGRTVATLGRLLAPAQLAAAGVHGAELRLPDGERLASGAPDLTRVRAGLEDFAVAHPGVLVEDKGVAVALHYRRAPHVAAAAIAAAEAAARDSHGALEVQHGKMVVEVRPAGADKGRALGTFMMHAPFAGRRPIAIGDDVTDEAMFATARTFGGMAVRVGPANEPTAASLHIADPAALRAWLATLE